MITEHYPNPNKPPEKAPYVYAPPVVSTSKAGEMLNGHGLSFNQHWADKMGVPLHTFVSRDKKVKDEFAKVAFRKNAAVWPADPEECKKHGKCRVLGVAMSYRDFHEWDWEWDDSKPTYIVEAYSEENKFSVFLATAKYFQMNPPVEKPVEVVVEYNGAIG